MDQKILLERAILKRNSISVEVILWSRKHISISSCESFTHQNTNNNSPLARSKFWVHDLRYSKKSYLMCGFVSLHGSGQDLAPYQEVLGGCWPR